MTREEIEQSVYEAIANAYCHPKNSHKIVDLQLAEAIAFEVLTYIHSKLVISSGYVPSEKDFDWTPYLPGKEK